MASLADVEVPSEDVPMGNMTIRLRALNLSEVAHLFRTHTATVARNVEAFGPLFTNAPPTQMYTAALALVGECSDLVADVIATAAGEPERVAEAAALPIDAQFRAIITIIRLTLGTTDPERVMSDFYAAMGPAAAAFRTRH